MKLDIPESLQLREQTIRTALANAGRTGGRTGEAAQVLENILLPHLMRERVDVLQPLALLPRLARGDVTPEMAEVLPQIDKLKSDLHRLHIEHSAILSMIKQLVTAAREEGKSHHVRFARRLLFRAWLDESVFYPAAILIGKYLRLRLAGAYDRAVEGNTAQRGGHAKFELPESLQLSRVELSAALQEAVRFGGKTGLAAELLVQIQEPRLQKEDRSVLQTLGVLAPLAADEIDPAMLERFPDIESLETNGSELDREHSAIVEAAAKLLKAAQAEGADGVTDFAERLLLRARMDQEVFYPAAILIRDYLRLILQLAPPPTRPTYGDLSIVSTKRNR